MLTVADIVEISAALVLKSRLDLLCNELLSPDEQAELAAMEALRNYGILITQQTMNDHGGQRLLEAHQHLVEMIQNAK